MLDKTDESQLKTVSGADLAIGIQLSATIGQTRSLTLTTGIPLDYAPEEINRVLDKLAAAADRQKKKHDLEQTRMLLKNEEQNLHVHRAQFMSQQTKFQSEWDGSKRRGSFEPRGAQQSILDGLQKNINNSLERLAQLRAGIKEAEEQCR